MVIIKNQEQIDGIRKSCQLLAEVMAKVKAEIKPGISVHDLDMVAEKLIIDAGGRPAFKGYHPGGHAGPFPTTLCTSVNDVVVHGPAVDSQPLQEGSVVGVDCGIELDGYFSDMAFTVAVGKVDSKVEQLLKVSEKSLYNAIDQMKSGNKIRDISKAIEDTVSPHNYGIVKNYAGHGVGVEIHEDPWIPNFVDEMMKDSLDIELKPGMVLAIEPMITLGGGDVEVGDDNWSVKTIDNSITAHFEHSILITEKGNEVLTSING